MDKSFLIALLVVAVIIGGLLLAIGLRDGFGGHYGRRLRPRAGEGDYGKETEEARARRKAQIDSGNFGGGGFNGGGGFGGFGGGG